MQVSLCSFFTSICARKCDFRLNQIIILQSFLLKSLHEMRWSLHHLFMRHVNWHLCCDKHEVCFKYITGLLIGSIVKSEIHEFLPTLTDIYVDCFYWCLYFDCIAINTCTMSTNHHKRLATITSSVKFIKTFPFYLYRRLAGSCWSHSLWISQIPDKLIHRI